MGLAATWLEWELAQASVEQSAPELADYLLCTVSSQQGMVDLKRGLRRIKNKKAKIILGGGGCYAPAIFDDLIDVACVGEGPRFIRTLLNDSYDACLRLPEAWVPKEKRTVVPFGGFPWECPPLRHPDGTVRVWGARGCKYKCLFCQTGWEAEYRENPDLCLLQFQIDSLQNGGERVAVITNDGATCSVRIRGQQEFLSMRLSGLLKLMPITRGIAKSIRIGVEGISERLRNAVAKPIKNEDLLNVTFNALSNGVGVRWFFIPGLPGETDEDYGELRWLVGQLKKLSKGCVMMNFHAFIPQPATPLCVLPLRDGYWPRFDDFRHWFFHGLGFTRHVQIVSPAQHAGRLKRAMESMAATESELRRGWFEHDNPNWRVQYLLPPDKLRRIAAKYAEKMGLVNKPEHGGEPVLL